MQMLNSELIHTLDGKVVVLKKDRIAFNPNADDRQGARFEVDLSQLPNDYKNAHDDLMATIAEYWKAARRNLIKESYEVTRLYAKAIGVSLKTQSWYQFARMVRNCLSHDFHFRFNNYDLEQLPVSWGGKEINATLNDTDMPEDFLDPYTTWALYMEMVTFIETAEAPQSA
ncbi:hypothetical protein KDW78_19965 [Burkholderia cenocepacia]|uniref:hypothetical protein n=1 Tax=Burkholderia cenocepacia TaxID=95486 RepID=UPI00158EE95B|nr:hypothetical protein [Burkholderia cenocepacia]MBR7956153.1 hypothetical protein [Burkholderia cenocepacia]